LVKEEGALRGNGSYLEGKGKKIVCVLRLGMQGRCLKGQGEGWTGMKRLGFEGGRNRWFNEGFALGSPVGEKKRTGKKRHRQEAENNQPTANLQVGAAGSVRLGTCIQQEDRKNGSRLRLPELKENERQGPTCVRRENR